MGDERGVSAGAVLVAFVSGAALGAIAALWLAPQVGEQTREQLRGYARRTEKGLRELAETAGETFEKAVGRGRGLIAEKKSVLTEAFEAGREAMRRERERLSGEKKR